MATEKQPYRVLLAERDDRTAALISHRLARIGVEMTRCVDGHQVMAKAESTLPHLLLLDAELPGISGFELLRQLRRDERFSSHPIVLLSGSGNESEHARALDLGADDIVVKPFSPVELTARIRRLLERTYRGRT